jgi:hypothetical protein
MTNPEPISDRRAVAMAFLQRVLPSHGMYFSAVKTRTGKGVKRLSCATLTELWDALSSEVTDTYFSTATFKDNSSSAAANIEAIQALRLDVDCGPKKPYSTAAKGMIAILHFAQAAGLPPPGLILSGSGVHAYWPLSTALSRRAWERYAEGLKATCKAHGLQADHTVTTDAARILRCPGTFNCKLPGVPIEVEAHSSFFKCGPYDAALFDRLCIGNVVDLPLRVETLEPQSVGQPSSPALYCPATVKHYASMLSAIPIEERDNRQVWVETGMALYELGWGDAGLTLWSLWSARSGKYDEGEQRRMWESFARPYDGPKITMGSLVRRAEQHGWKPPVEPPVAPLFPNSACDNEPVQFSAERLKRERAWNLTAAGKVRDHNYQNTRIALATLGLRARYNVFIDKKDAIVPWISPEWITFSDDLIAPIRKQILDHYKFDPGKDCVVDVLEEFAIDGSYDPVVDYLKSLEWDGVKRLETWLTTYTGADDNKLNRCFGLVTIVAAVRRALHPGTKFDHMLILEGVQGTGKSTVVEILGLREYYKNQAVNFQDPRSVIEALNGAWFYEWAELAGMRRTESERLKAMLSTSVDCARMAYGRMVTIRPRRCVIMGTTNAVQGEYLSDYTGGRRYWPVVTTKIKLDELRRDVGQLFAEAVTVERDYGPLTLPASLIDKALAIQKSRTQKPEWVDLLSDIKGFILNKGTPLAEERVLAKDITTQWLKLTAAQMNSGTYRSISNAMRELGWEMKVFRHDGMARRGYVKFHKQPEMGHEDNGEVEFND